MSRENTDTIRAFYVVMDLADQRCPAPPSCSPRTPSSTLARCDRSRRTSRGWWVCGGPPRGRRQVRLLLDDLRRSRRSGAGARCGRVPGRGRKVVVRWSSTSSTSSAVSRWRDSSVRLVLSSRRSPGAAGLADRERTPRLAHPRRAAAIVAHASASPASVRRPRTFPVVGQGVH